MAGSSAGPTKRSREERDAHLLAFGKSSYSTKSAIESDLRRARDEGIPETFSRRAQYDARKRKVGEASNPYGQVVEQLSLAMTPKAEKQRKSSFAALVHPDSMIWLMAKESEWFSATMQRTLRATPCTRERPWRIILYALAV